MKRTIFSFFLLSLFIGTGFSQDVVPKPEKVIDYTIGKKYEIGGITVSGVKFLSKSVLKMYLFVLKSNNSLYVLPFYHKNLRI